MITGIRKQVGYTSLLHTSYQDGVASQRFKGNCQKSCSSDGKKETSCCSSKKQPDSYSPKGLIAVFSAILGLSSLFFLSENRNLTQEKDACKQNIDNMNLRLDQLESSTYFLSDKVQSLIEKSSSQVTLTTISDIAKAVTPSTVRVINEMIMKNKEGKIVKIKSGGSGVLIEDTTNGKKYVLTNSHVIYRPLMETFKDKYDDPDKYVIQLYTGDDVVKPIEFETRVVILPDGKRAESAYQDPKCHDLALLEVSDSALKQFPDTIKPVKFRKDLPDIGELAVVVGNPANRPVELMDTLTAGVISHHNRFMPENPNTKYIQTDAAVNPGNSGGGLFDAQKRLLGIVTFHEGDDLGVAISGETVQEVLKDWGISVDAD